MSIGNVQAISGVSAGVENVVMTVYPSIAATGRGRWLGRLYDAIPVRICGVKLSNLLFTLPTSPLALALYAETKVVGSRYVLTNRRVTINAALTPRQVLEVALPAIDEIEVEQLDGQQFFHAADLVLLDSRGTVLGRLEAVPRAEVFRQTILEARDALTQTEAALATISARQTA
ncbi:MAG: PH domain-containing protein [Planctomycetaceae bacterium]|jgi:hypothetical protein|nr:PH domain-containing protein [Planctomycetaceae bacterium]MBT6155275.1 PH domain-containing protein [Planctomycetaceae bacterium]MBT6485229.1 PH domain-containing protein [Planctomycetaceae bacterium]MBT6497418.1 PH domain-containing protein [Planctomycetaceae bacterium]